MSLKNATHPDKLVTAGLPYANGEPHLGHLLEYCLADIYVRSQRALGDNVLFLCGTDSHGTPIEMNAAKQGLPPEQFVAQMDALFQSCFRAFHIEFDHYSMTHNPANRQLVESTYAQLLAAGDIQTRTIMLSFCDSCQRFLPDRLIKGSCPRCQSTDQYGDVCENCGATYEPTDLLGAYCALCQKPPVRRESAHLFFHLSNPQRLQILQQFVKNGALDDKTQNFVQTWLAQGIRDWCISRDAPYFGFQVPGFQDKYFYVWLDAPLGYIAATIEWGERYGVDGQALWRKDNSCKVQHIIGKDIVYFHTLFWPGLLSAMHLKLPNDIFVHGMLTVNNVKMSKSRGTFVTAAQFLKYFPSETLRYYFASKLTSEPSDIDFSFTDLMHKVNAELVNKYANLFSRAAQFIGKHFNHTTGDLPFTQAELYAPALPVGEPPRFLVAARTIVGLVREVETCYRQRELAQAMQKVAQIADIGNEVMQSEKPWDSVKRNPTAALDVCSFAINVCHVLAILLQPVVPRFAKEGGDILQCAVDSIHWQNLFGLRHHRLGAMKRLMERIEPTTIAAIEAELATSSTPPAAAANEKVAVANVGIDDFKNIDLKVGTITAANRIAKSQKLLHLSVDCGEKTERSIVAGLGLAYAPESLLQTQVIVVTNLKPIVIMGHPSHGMVLAASDETQVRLLRPDATLSPGAKVS